MTSPEEKIAGLTADVRNMASDIHEIKALIRESTKETKLFHETMAKQSERISLMEVKTITTDKRLEDINESVGKAQTHINKIENVQIKVKWWLIGAGAAGGAITGILPKLISVGKVFMM